ncbi:hypothetical protein GCM10011608_11090 [Micromonospora sonchi]|uniref:Uncharacterized protein n=1 Tax=Micromonospora sonchi TaxID=1763543 RepID=A0A917TLU2_9ACTN|nr:hypothetical protein GCM10011608_11090 [Micromonospora sonchi]
MSVSRVTEIRCDGPGCDSAWVWDGNATEVRRLATTNGGWLTARDGGRDFCTTTCRDNPEESR